LKLPLRYIVLLFFSLNIWLSIAQSSFFLKDDVSQKINFEFASNLIIIPLEINGVALSFVLDSGVSKPILFNLTDRDSLYLKNTKTFFLHGLGGDGKLEALKSSNNRLKIGNAVSVNQDLYVVFDNAINFTPRLGVLVHGIIGYDLFKDFVVEINYNSKYIRLHKPDSFKPKSSKKWKNIPIDINRKKPFIKAKVAINEKEIPLQLLIDTGSSDALWLFENSDEGLIPDKDLYFIDYLGRGLSGSVYGKRSKVKKFQLGNFNLLDANVAFPDSASIDVTRIYKDRNGSLGGDVLKRFNLFFDYTNKMLHLKKNGFYKDAFTYNNSGIVLEHNGSMFVKQNIEVPTASGLNTDTNSSAAVKIKNFINHIMVLKPAYKIVELRELSNAYVSGLRIGDILIVINGKFAYNYKLSELNSILHGKTGKTIRVKVERNGKTLSFKFKLGNAFNKKEPSN
jgi:hypothetical protein